MIGSGQNVQKKAEQFKNLSSNLIQKWCMIIFITGLSLVYHLFKLIL